MSIQKSIHDAMYTDIDDLTVIIRRMQLQRGVCRSDVVALESHIALPSSIHQYTESPSRTHYDRTLKLAKAKRKQLHTDLYSMESAALLGSKPDWTRKELVTAMEAITGRHFLLFGGVLAMIAILLKFFGVDGGSGGGGGGGGGAAVAAVAKVTSSVEALGKFVDSITKQINDNPKPNAANPIVTSHTKNAPAALGALPDNHQALVLAAESVAVHIKAMFQTGITEDALGKILVSPASMSAFLLDNKAVVGVCFVLHIQNKLVSLDNSRYHDNFCKFLDTLGAFLDTHLDTLNKFLSDVAAGREHTPVEIQSLLNSVDVYAILPGPLLSNVTPSTVNDRLSAATRVVHDAKLMLNLGVNTPRSLELVRAKLPVLPIVGDKIKELFYTGTPDYDMPVDEFKGIVEKALSEPVDKLAATIDKYTNRLKELTNLQTQLVAVDKQLAEKHEMHRDHATPEQALDMAGIRYVNASLTFVVRQMYNSINYLHGKTVMAAQIERFISSYKAALTAYLKLHTEL